MAEFDVHYFSPQKLTTRSADGGIGNETQTIDHSKSTSQKVLQNFQKKIEALINNPSTVSTSFEQIIDRRGNILDPKIPSMIAPFTIENEFVGIAVGYNPKLKGGNPDMRQGSEQYFYVPITPETSNEEIRSIQNHLKQEVLNPSGTNRFGFNAKINDLDNRNILNDLTINTESQARWHRENAGPETIHINWSATTYTGIEVNTQSPDTAVFTTDERLTINGDLPVEVKYGIQDAQKKLLKEAEKTDFRSIIIEQGLEKEPLGKIYPLTGSTDDYFFLDVSHIIHQKKNDSAVDGSRSTELSTTFYISKKQATVLGIHSPEALKDLWISKGSTVYDEHPNRKNTTAPHISFDMGEAVRFPTPANIYDYKAAVGAIRDYINNPNARAEKFYNVIYDPQITREGLKKALTTLAKEAHLGKEGNPGMAWKYDALQQYLSGESLDHLRAKLSAESTNAKRPKQGFLGLGGRIKEPDTKKRQAASAALSFINILEASNLSGHLNTIPANAQERDQPQTYQRGQEGTQSTGMTELRVAVPGQYTVKNTLDNNKIFNLSNFQEAAALPAYAADVLNFGTENNKDARNAQKKFLAQVNLLLNTVNLDAEEGKSIKNAPPARENITTNAQAWAGLYTSLSRLAQENLKEFGQGKYDKQLHDLKLALRQFDIETRDYEDPLQEETQIEIPSPPEEYLHNEEEELKIPEAPPLDDGLTEEIDMTPQTQTDIDTQDYTISHGGYTFDLKDEHTGLPTYMTDESNFSSSEERQDFLEKLISLLKTLLGMRSISSDTNAQAAVSSMKKTQEAWKSSLNTLQDTHADQAQEIQTFFDQIGERQLAAEPISTTDLTSLRAENKDLIKNNTTLLQENQDLAQELQQLREQVATLQAENTSLRDEDSNISVLQSQNAILNRQLNEAYTEIQNRGTALRQRDAEIQQLQETNNALEELASDWQKKATSLSHDPMDTIEGANSDQMKAIQTLTATTEELNEKNEALEEENQNLREAAKKASEALKQNNQLLKESEKSRKRRGIAAAAFGVTTAAMSVVAGVALLGGLNFGRVSQPAPSSTPEPAPTTQVQPTSQRTYELDQENLKYGSWDAVAQICQEARVKNPGECANKFRDTAERMEGSKAYDTTTLNDHEGIKAAYIEDGKMIVEVEGVSPKGIDTVKFAASMQSINSSR